MPLISNVIREIAVSQLPRYERFYWVAFSFLARLFAYGRGFQFLHLTRVRILTAGTSCSASSKSFH